VGGAVQSWQVRSSGGIPAKVDAQVAFGLAWVQQGRVPGAHEPPTGVQGAGGGVGTARRTQRRTVPCRSQASLGLQQLAWLVQVWPWRRQRQRLRRRSQYFVQHWSWRVQVLWRAVPSPQGPYALTCCGAGREPRQHRPEEPHDRCPERVPAGAAKRSRDLIKPGSLYVCSSSGLD
jgi:hypothetical protein